MNKLNEDLEEMEMEEESKSNTGSKLSYSTSKELTNTSNNGHHHNDKIVKVINKNDWISEIDMKLIILRKLNYN